MANERIGVMGGTGDTGRLVVERLLERGAEVSVFARNASKSRDLFGDAVQLVEGAIGDRAAIGRLLDFCDTIVFSLNAKNMSWQSGPGPKQVNYGGLATLLEVAAERGFPGRIVYVSSLFVTRRWTHPIGILLNTILKRSLYWNLQAESLLRDSGVAYTLVRPGGLKEEPGGDYRIVLGQGDKQTGFIARPDAADVIAEAALNPLAANRDIDCVRDLASKGSGAANDYPAMFQALLGR